MRTDTSQAPRRRSPGRRRGGVIHDLGYRRYDGPRLGRSRIVAALAWHSFRSAFGFGRGAEGQDRPGDRLHRDLPARDGQRVRHVQGQPAASSTTTPTSPCCATSIMTIFVAVQAPELVSRDLRSRVLPLYFSRPIKPGDYPLAKYLGFTAACLVMLEVPLLLLWGGVRRQRARRRGRVGADEGADPRPARRPHVGGVAGRDQPVPRVADRQARLRDRARWRSRCCSPTPSRRSCSRWRARPSCARGPALAGGHGPPPSLAEKAAGLFSPFTLFNGVRMWLGGTNPADNVPKPGAFGAVYALVLIVLVGLCLAGLAARYRKARLS